MSAHGGWSSAEKAWGANETEEEQRICVLLHDYVREHPFPHTLSVRERVAETDAFLFLTASVLYRKDPVRTWLFGLVRHVEGNQHDTV